MMFRHCGFYTSFGICSFLMLLGSDGFVPHVSSEGEASSQCSQEQLKIPLSELEHFNHLCSRGVPAPCALPGLSAPLPRHAALFTLECLQRKESKPSWKIIWNMPREHHCCTTGFHPLSHTHTGLVFSLSLSLFSCCALRAVRIAKKRTAA